MTILSFILPLFLAYLYLPNKMAMSDKDVG